MQRKRFDDMNCGVAQALDQVGDWWTLLIVRDAFFDKTRFSEFQESLGIAKNILSDRLRNLVDNGILEKERLAEPGERYAYRLTKKGRDLWLVLTAMRLWSDKWVFGNEDVPLVARENDSHRELASLLAVDRKGQPIEPSKLEWASRPARRRTGTKKKRANTSAKPRSSARSPERSTSPTRGASR